MTTTIEDELAELEAQRATICKEIAGPANPRFAFVMEKREVRLG